MKTTARLKARRLVLGIIGVAFFLIAVVSLVAPHTMAGLVGYTLDSTTALNEFRAIYVGLWLAHVLICFAAAWRVDHLILGDIVGVLLLGQVLGRVTSLVLDGLPDAAIAAPAIAELLGAVLVFSLRKGSSPETTEVGHNLRLDRQSDD